MKRLLFCLFLFTAPLLGTIAQLGHTSAGSGTGNGVTTSAISTTGASLLTLQVVSLVGVAEPALTDSTMNVTWTACGAVQSTDIELKIHGYYSVVTNVNQTSGTQTFTATQTGSFPSLFVQSWSGTHASAPADQNTGSVINSTAQTILPGSITPTQDNEVVITAVGANGTDSNFTINGGFTEQNEVTGTATAYGGSMAFLIQTTAAAADPTWDNNIGSKRMAATICSFKAAAAATGEGFLKRRRR